MTLEALSIDTQKDEIIARLILQKCAMYAEYTEGWLDEFISRKELYHVVTYATNSDCEHFSAVWVELEKLWNDGVMK